MSRGLPSNPYERCQVSDWKFVFGYMAGGEGGTLSSLHVRGRLVFAVSRPTCVRSDPSVPSPDFPDSF